MSVYLIEDSGVLTGPVELPVIPGLGVQLPGNAIELSKPLPMPNEGCLWVLVDGKPSQLVDNRGWVYRTDTGTREDYLQLGELPEGFTAIPRPSVAYDWNGTGWAPNLTYLHAEATARINSACEATITGGFSSSALGAAHIYSSQLDDQLNLTGVILSGLDSPYACRDELGVKAFRPHTVKQIRRVGDDFTLFKLQMLQKALQLKQSLDQALQSGDAEALQAVVWESAQP
jgi:hypothetical protein